MRYSTCVRCMSKVVIGDVTKIINRPKNPEYVPKNYFDKSIITQSTLNHLKWMLEKDLLKQDIFLLGPPGFKRRHLALQYAELVNNEVEYVALNRDTTEADLKQRREIINGCTVYFDQSAVRAALYGRTLILEGIEKAERNVLPVLNNLLENREMHLEDGRLLIPAHRFDKLLKKFTADQLKEWKLERVHENFRVIALGIPVPRFTGNPLDPPLRSRFQARNVSFDSYQDYLELLTKLAPNVSINSIEKLLTFSFAINESEQHGLSLPQFPINNLRNAAKIWNNNPSLNEYNILYRLYPYKSFYNTNLKVVQDLLTKFDIEVNTEILGNEHNLARTIQRHGQIFVNELPFVSNETLNYLPIEYQNLLINQMKENLQADCDFCLIGSRGCGKSIMVQKVIEDLNQKAENVILYNDMTSRDLLQQRFTKENGDTFWKPSPLVSAALKGKIAVLDGLHRVHPSTLAAIFRLTNDRELQLHDGNRLVNEQRFNQLKNDYQKSDQDMENSGILKIHKDFRIIALAEPPELKHKWLNDELLSLFLFHETRKLSKLEEMNLINAKVGSVSKPLKEIIDFAHYLRKYEDESIRNLSEHLSTRQLLRIAARFKKFPNEDIYDTISETLMIKFLPSLTRKTLQLMLKKFQILPTNTKFKNSSILVKNENGILQIGNTQYETQDCKWPAKVPNVIFYDVPHHYRLMENMLKDFILGYHILLVGNQGVGKNKIVDRFLQLLNRSREYIQLHRDTTVQTLTIQPTIREGRLIYDDSPLVRAIKEGHVLVIDEADKAPVHVTSILKNLVESGEMVLSNGNRIQRKSSKNDNDPDVIISHPDFRLIVLANRPGFPFLGNDFFDSLGDLFSCHSVDNPPAETEINLLKNYAPSLSEDILKTLVSIFGDLRSYADEGTINYPFSTREVVNIVKHLEKFPNSNLVDVMMNVFNFDLYSKNILQVINAVLQKHSLITTNLEKYIIENVPREKLRMSIDRISGLDASSPKHGKEDPNNDPHVGGNTWAGGTGGRDTAGLGGKGGPYRLDKGHQIYQLSDEEKSSVPDHVKKAAREVGLKAFKEKLKEIQMSEYDASIYNHYSQAVSNEVESIRVLLDNLELGYSERIWSRNQTSGEIDDGKLIDGILGDKNIYRKRIDHMTNFQSNYTKPKRVRFVIDVSGSMYRFNSYDGRLNRELELAVLIMEAFDGFEEKVLYDIIGHSGDNACIKFVNIEEYPKNNQERLQILQQMIAHSQYCWSGDNTLKASEYAIKSLSEENYDQSIVIILSDANLKRYDIQPKALYQLLFKYPTVNSFVFFIGSLGNEALKTVQSLPPGKAYLCNNVNLLPTIMKEIFSSTFS